LKTKLIQSKSSAITGRKSSGVSGCKSSGRRNSKPKSDNLRFGCLFGLSGRDRNGPTQRVSTRNRCRGNIVLRLSVKTHDAAEFLRVVLPAGLDAALDTDFLA
jgi:hypothetical protein